MENKHFGENCITGMGLGHVMWSVVAQSDKYR